MTVFLLSFHSRETSEQITLYFEKINKKSSKLSMEWRFKVTVEIKIALLLRAAVQLFSSLLVWRDCLGSK